MPAAIAAMDADDFIAVCAAKPAIHRFPKSMGKRIHEMCTFLVDHYDGDAEAIWRDAPSGEDLYRRLRELPGYGEEKSKIFVAILGKRMGVAPPGGRRPRRRSPTSSRGRSPTSPPMRRSSRCGRGSRP